MLIGAVLVRFCVDFGAAGMRADKRTIEQVQNALAKKRKREREDKEEAG